MVPKEALVQARAWMEKKIGQSKRPFADKFDFTSVGYCLSEAIDMHKNWTVFEETFALIREVTVAQNSPRHAVFTPEEILALIGEALKLI